MIPTQEEIAQMSDEELKSRILTDLEFYSYFCLKIRDKSGNLVKLKFNRSQQIMHEYVEKMREVKGYVRIVLLKYRQFGGSTYIGARLFHKATTQPLMYGKVVGHTADSTRGLFQMQQRFLDNYPTFMKPMTKYVSKEELYFASAEKDQELKARNPGLDSKISVLSARAVGAGRGDTHRSLHCSEIPLWDKPDQTMLGLLNTVPKDEVAKRGTEVFLESTAAGVGDYFYRAYQEAKSGRSDFWALFLPWYLMEEYRAKLPINFKATEEERKLMEQEHPEWAYVNEATGKKTLSPEQVYWRRITIATECDGDLRKFQQEYPLTDTEAFITSGAPFFEPEMVMKRIEVVRAGVKPIFVGDVELPKEVGTDLGKIGRALQHQKIKLVPNQYGPLSVWREPQPNETYYWGADVADGLRNGDKSVWTAFCRQDGYQVARWRGALSPDLFAFVIYILGKHYGWAYGAPESNAHGLTTLYVLKEICYPGIHLRTQYDKLKSTPTQVEGWHTSLKTRPLMLDSFRRGFMQDQIQVNDLDTLMEMQTFVRDDETGKFAAQDGCFDDCVMAASIASMMGEEIKPTPPRRKSRISAKGGKYDRAERDAWTGY